ncbi:hypothetical protein SLEP1_g10028 [Rubroshorea leprosula]|uniref:Uncharacterized protein n=1 Tax=Rubroshorea leprosula TaxID=152421 RepID=A0AAV5ICQ3_9ROSI|nr:hypothetical protein SLEP1_g10028 [Rubroshorea leprosula]
MKTEGPMDGVQNEAVHFNPSLPSEIDIGNGSLPESNFGFGSGYLVDLTFEHFLKFWYFV